MSQQEKIKFGTFGGVFTPSILTIFGLIMFMRSNYVVGNAGVYQSLIILLLSSAITLLTALSISAISSNTPVHGGGAYFLISRVLGPGFGTAIGIALFMAQALSIPFYILGFSEALCNSFPNLEPWYKLICIGALVLLFIMAWIGTSGIIKIQYLLLAALLASITIFLAGAWKNYSDVHFNANLHANYSQGENIWTMFAIYFPAVTGIMAGVNMSGDLINPKKSIPKGTLYAVIFGALVYGVQMLLCAGMTSNSELKERPFLVLIEAGDSLLLTSTVGLGFMVIGGVLLATLSSAIGSYLGAPRVLQALSADGTIRSLGIFSKLSKKGEPHNALLASFLVSLAVLFFINTDDKSGLNTVAEIVTMVFLYTYGMTNLAAFVESSGANPSFRPSFRFFHWSTALLGAIGCIWSAFMINPSAAAVALTIIILLYYLAKRNENTAVFSDARRGFIYSRVSRNMQILTKMKENSKNWRPTILVFVGVLNKRVNLVQFSKWLGKDAGIVSLVNVITGELKDCITQRDESLEQMNHFIESNKLALYPEVVIMKDFDSGLSSFIQGHSLAPIKPNIVMFGWPQKETRTVHFYKHLQTVAELNKNIICVMDKSYFLKQGSKKVIDCWWRGCDNGSFMIMLAYLISQNAEWENTTIRLMRQVPNEEEKGKHLRELQHIATEARIEAHAEIIISNESYQDVLNKHSRESNLVVLGIEIPAAGQELAHYTAIEKLLTQMPTTILVKSIGDVDLKS
jgi:amino acid transporter